MSSPLDALRRAILDDDVEAARALLSDAAPAGRLDEGWFDFGRPPLAAARSREMADLLLECGAQLAALGNWWAPGFWLEEVDAGVAAHLVERGARLTAHAAAGLGLADRLRELLDEDPARVDEKGGDGARPLHFARTVEVARLLLDRGADPAALDDDHRSSPAQWRVGDRPEVVRLLLAAGAPLDVFLAVGLDDPGLVERAVAADPECTGHRIGDNHGPFPGIGFAGGGGTILQWALGFNRSPHEIAIERGRRDLFDYLLKRTAPRPKLLVACMTGDEALARSLVAAHPGIVERLEEDGRTLLARACWETNRNNEAVRIMLELGFPVDVPEPNHGHTPLHNAAWDGNAELVDLLIRHGHPVDVRDPEHRGTPLGWCIHAATEARRGERDYAGVVDRLLAAGAAFDREAYPVGRPDIDAVLRRRRAL